MSSSLTTNLEPRYDPNNPIYTSPTLRNTLWHTHGLLLSTSFLILYPLGILAIRSSSPLAFRYHWLLQASASILALTGIIVGFVTSKGIVLWHQYLGLLLGAAVLGQVVAGWKHHVYFVRVRRRTWVSYLHLWMGRGMMGVAWVNVFLGLRLREYNWFVVGLAVAAMGGMAVVWTGWGIGMIGFGKGGWLRGRKQGGVSSVREEGGREGLMRAAADDFALDDLGDEEDEDDGLTKGREGDKA